MSARVFCLAHAGAVKRSVLDACRRLGLCDAARRDAVNRAMVCLRNGQSAARAISEGRAFARSMARAAARTDPEPAA